jgi:aspartate aminotransferase
MMPSGAFYAFPNTSLLYGLSAGNKKISSSGDLALYLLEEAKVALVHGEAFGDNDYVRLSYATSPDDIRRGIERIREAINRLEVSA